MPKKASVLTKAARMWENGKEGSKSKEEVPTQCQQEEQKPHQNKRFSLSHTNLFPKKKRAH